MGFDLLNLEKNVAVVIGGTSGIGRAIALGLAKAGADVVPASRRMEEVDQTASEIESLGRRSFSFVCDVTDRTSLQDLHGRVIEKFGRVDILINSAGTTRRTPTMECPEDEWNRIMEVNLTGTLRACQIFGRTMREQNYGRIVNIASLSAFVAFHEVAAYAASKSGVASLTKSLAIEWAPYGVCVNAVAPGIVRTSLNQELLDNTARGRELLLRTPMRRFGDVEEVAGAAVFLSSRAASYVTGEVLVVDGGFMASGVNQ